MGKVFSHYVTRNARNWNVESRAMKLLEKNKLEAAPKHPSTTVKIEQFKKEHPELLDIQKEKNSQLDAMLKGLTVPAEKLEIKSSQSKLPQSRARVEDPEYGYLEPSIITEGRCTIRQALSFISNHAADPMKHTSDSIALQYKLDKRQVEQTLKHFQMLWIQTSLKESSKSEKMTIAATQTFFNAILPKSRENTSAKNILDNNNASKQERNTSVTSE